MAPRVTLGTVAASAAVSVPAVALATVVSPPGSAVTYIGRGIGIVLAAVVLVHGTNRWLAGRPE